MVIDDAGCNAAPCAAREVPDGTRALAAFNEPRAPSVLATFRIMARTVYQLRAQRDHDNRFKKSVVYGLMTVTSCVECSIGNVASCQEVLHYYYSAYQQTNESWIL